MGVRQGGEERGQGAGEVLPPHTPRRRHRDVCGQHIARTRAGHGRALGLRSDLHGTGVRVTSIEPGMVETEFTLVRTGGDKQASDTLYGGANPMTAEDIAETLLWVATLPPHLNINTLELMPVSQSFAGFQVARQN